VEFGVQLSAERGAGAGWLCAGSNPQLDRLRQSSDVHVSLDDEEMREVDPEEHREALGAGIPQHLGRSASLINSIVVIQASCHYFTFTDRIPPDVMRYL